MGVGTGIGNELPSNSHPTVQVSRPTSTTPEMSDMDIQEEVEEPHDAPGSSQRHLHIPENGLGLFSTSSAHLYSDSDTYFADQVIHIPDQDSIVKFLSILLISFDSFTVVFVFFLSRVSVLGSCGPLRDLGFL